MSNILTIALITLGVIILFFGIAIFREMKSDIKILKKERDEEDQLGI